VSGAVAPDVERLLCQHPWQAVVPLVAAVARSVVVVWNCQELLEIPAGVDPIVPDGFRGIQEDRICCGNGAI